jgi:hypothetical protein
VSRPQTNVAEPDHRQTIRRGLDEELQECRLSALRLRRQTVVSQLGERQVQIEHGQNQVLLLAVTV